MQCVAWAKNIRNKVVSQQLNNVPSGPHNNVPSGPGLLVLDERPFLELLKGNAELFLGIHDNGAVPGDRLADRLSRYEKKADRDILGG